MQGACVLAQIGCLMSRNIADTPSIRRKAKDALLGVRGVRSYVYDAWLSILF